MSTRARLVGPTGIDCDAEGCLPHRAECTVRPQDRAVCEATFLVMLDAEHVRIARALRDDHDLMVHGVPVASTGSGGRYLALCGQPSDRLWHRVRSVDGARVNAWVAASLSDAARP